MTVRASLAALLTVAAVAACGGSDPEKPGPDAEKPADPAITSSSTPSPKAATTRPEPSRASHPRPSAPGQAGAAGVPLGKDFRLTEGQSVAIKGTDLVVSFTRLVSDSRCPTNVTCIQQGEATIAIKVAGQGQPQSFELSVPPGQGTGDKRLGKYLIHLEAVEPSPAEPAGPAGGADTAYVAVLRVNRA